VSQFNALQIPYRLSFDRRNCIVAPFSDQYFQG